jgi:16S rRNA (uracil1498-N3)-methyltransferase
MTIHPSMSIEQFVHARLAAEVWLLHPSPHANPSGHVNPIVARLAGAPNSGGALRSTAFLVGPEGGFTDEEVLTATRCGASLMSLGDRILRVETAVAVAATIGDLWLGTSQ